MHLSDILADSISDIKGIYVILSSMASDCSKGSYYTNIDSALSVLAKKVYDISVDLETVYRLEK